MIDPVKLTQDLIKCASVTPLDEGAQDVLIKALEPLGFTAHDVSSGNIRNTFFRLGNGTPHFCFCGHTDVVPVGDEKSWMHPPFAAVIENDTLYGRGASDMKGNIACFVAALSRFLNGRDFNGSLSLLITGDEEADAVDGTAKVLEWMNENGHVPDVALVGEPTNPQKLGDEIKIGRRGSLTGTVTVTGIQGHVAYPHLADNPLPKIARLATVLSEYEFDQGSEFFPPTNLELTTIDTGNKADNVIPEKAVMKFNVRFNDHWTAQSLGEKIKALIDDTNIVYDIAMSSNAESFITAPGDFTTLVSEAVENTTGHKPELSTKGGTSDARFVQAYCPVVEFGLINKTIHQVDECTALSDLHSLTEIYTHILENYFRA